MTAAVIIGFAVNNNSHDVEPAVASASRTPTSSPTPPATDEPDDTPTPRPTATPVPPPLAGHLVFVSDRNSNENIYTVSVNNSSKSASLISDSGLDYAPFWAAASSDIVFVSAREGKNDIYVMSSAGNGVRQLTFSPDGIYDPVLSPDGTKVAFRDDNGLGWVHVDSGDVVYSGASWGSDLAWSPDGNTLAYTDGYYEDNERVVVEILLVDTSRAGQDWEVILESSCNDYSCVDEIAWSPDGNWITLALAPDGENRALYNVRPDGSDLTEFVDMSGVEESNPVWSPDGRTLLFVGLSDTRTDDSINNCDNAAIYKVSAGGGAPVRLTDTSVESLAPVWSPDGDQIAYEVFENGSSEIYVMDADGENKKRLTNPALNADEYHPSWSPGGSQIVYASSGYVQRIYQLDLATGRQSLIADDEPLVEHSNPRLTLNGDQLAFTREYSFSSRAKLLLGGNGGTCSSERLVLIDDPLRYGGDDIPDDDLPLTRYLHGWSTNGDRLLYQGWSNGGFRIWEEAFDTSTSLNIPDNVSYYYSSFSPDGEFVTYYDYNTNEVILYAIANGAKIQLVDGIVVLDPILFAPDGKKIVYEGYPESSEYSDRKLFIRDTDGRLLNTISFLEEWYLEDYTWMPDGSGVVYELSDWPQSALWFYDVEAAESHLIATLPFDLFALTISPDGLWAAFETWHLGNQEIYAVPLAGGEAINLTQNPADEHTPVWVP